jgi:hypothetical protein
MCHWNVAIYKWEIELISFCRLISFLTGPHCQCQSVDQGMKQTWLYLLRFQVVQYYKYPISRRF